MLHHAGMASHGGSQPKPIPKSPAHKVGGQDSIARQIGRRIARQARIEPGRVFTPFDFLDLASPQNVGMTLLRLARAGDLRRLGRGLYFVPQTHPLLGELLPTAEANAEAVARKDGATLQPTEAMAANLLRLSEQVPVRVVFLTDGPSKTLTVGGMTIQLKRRPKRMLGSAAAMSSLVFAALRSLGKAHVTKDRVSHLRETRKPTDRKRLLRDLPFAPAWMHPILRYIAGADE